MNRREILLAAAATGLLAKASSAALCPYPYSPPTYSDSGWIYPLPGSGGPKVAGLGDPPSTPRPTLMFLYHHTPLSIDHALGHSLAVLLAARGWSAICVDVPGWSGCDRCPDEPKYLPGLRHRIENGRPLFSAGPNQLPFLERATAGLDRMIEAGYVDPARVAVCGFDIGALMAAHWMAVEPRVKAGAFVAPVLELLTQADFTGCTDPVAATSYDVRHLGALAGRPRFLICNESDTRTPPETCWNTHQAFKAAEPSTAEFAPDLQLCLVPGPTPPADHHKVPDCHLPHLCDWLEARV